ncbi:unnamed protein product [Caenorhabditis auriculariae]|uniref:Uncharacterized protein n=1 Tax=Caenorhabditis auriculariae TaxID=2777116 RepID=A0A8S1GQA8_9PELO|nr:unnamed protein product [Caenorhabditis auriculariae]
MIVWEWRRLFRQAVRSFTPKKPLSYQQWSRRRLITSFVLFFVGWKAFGYTLNDIFLWTVDEKTNVGRFLSPGEAKQLREERERKRDPQLSPIKISSNYELDD